MSVKCPECQSENVQTVNKKDFRGEWVWAGAFDCLDCGYEHPHQDTDQTVITSPKKSNQRL